MVACVVACGGVGGVGGVGNISDVWCVVCGVWCVAVAMACSVPCFGPCRCAVCVAARGGAACNSYGCHPKCSRGGGPGAW